MPDLQSVDMKGKVEGDVRQYSDAELMAIIAGSAAPIAAVAGAWRARRS